MGNTGGNQARRIAYNEFAFDFTRKVAKI